MYVGPSWGRGDTKGVVAEMMLERHSKWEGNTTEGLEEAKQTNSTVHAGCHQRLSIGV